ncbi:unnamed protein product [Psylliodes chrysocephalus]|uniref:Uncharacterized protein n=1 Tax=Psylliodes chrysocephalus TaxID=3402493 RepID=A0A9P0GBL8_9CUCU|nr:unnamed protein product [Psylliodes chrysocephala]
MILNLPDFNKGVKQLLQYIIENKLKEMYPNIYIVIQILLTVPKFKNATKKSVLQNKKIREQRIAAIKRNTGDILKFHLPIATAISASSSSADSKDEMVEIQNQEESEKIVRDPEPQLPKQKIDNIDFNNPKIWIINKDTVKMYIEHGTDFGDDVTFYPTTEKTENLEISG